MIQHSLLLELQWYLIIFDPLAYVLVLIIHLSIQLSLLFIQLGLSHFISLLTIQYTSQCLLIINYRLFNCINHHTHYRNKYYRGCWHSICPPIYLVVYTYNTTIIKNTTHNCLNIISQVKFRPCCNPQTQQQSLRLLLRNITK